MAAVDQGVKQEGGVRVILWGEESVVHRVWDRHFEAMLAPGAAMAGYKCREVVAHLARDNPMGGRPPGAVNVDRLALITGPVAMKTAMTYMVFGIPWCPAVVGHLAWILDTTRRQLDANFLTPIRRQLSQTTLFSARLNFFGV